MFLPSWAQWEMERRKERGGGVTSRYWGIHLGRGEGEAERHTEVEGEEAREATKKLGQAATSQLWCKRSRDGGRGERRGCRSIGS